MSIIIDHITHHREGDLSPLSLSEQPNRCLHSASIYSRCGDADATCGRDGERKKKRERWLCWVWGKREERECIVYAPSRSSFHNTNLPT